MDVPTYSDMASRVKLEYEPIILSAIELLRNPDKNAAIDAALAKAGEGLSISRAYLFLQNPDGTYSTTSEYCAPGISRQKDNLQNVAIAELARFFYVSLR